jgi:hypothetical protein
MRPPHDLRLLPQNVDDHAAAARMPIDLPPAAPSSTITYMRRALTGDPPRNSGGQAALLDDLHAP